MLSAQTKDEVTSATMKKLINEGVASVENMHKISE